MSRVKGPPARTFETVPEALGRLRVALEDAFLRASRELDLTPQQAELLCAAMSPAPVGQLAEALRCDRSNVSRLVDRASLRGLVRRRGGEEDGRVSVVELTREGQILAGRFMVALESHTEALRAEWAPPRHRLAVDLLNEISDVLEAGKQPPAWSRRRTARRSPLSGG